MGLLAHGDFAYERGLFNPQKKRGGNSIITTWIIFTSNNVTEGYYDLDKDTGKRYSVDNIDGYGDTRA